MIGVRVYCQDLGADADAGCGWPAFATKKGFVAPELDVAPCASAKSNEATTTVRGLARGHGFAIVAAAVDAEENTGPISSVVCVSPSGNLVPAGTIDQPALPEKTGCACRVSSPRDSSDAADAVTASNAVLVALLVGIAAFFRRNVR